MKKFISALLLMTLLAGCASGNEEVREENEEVEVSENIEQVEEESEQDEHEDQDSEDESQEVTEEDTASASDEEIDEAEEVDNYADAGELSKQDFFNPEEYDGHLITDNEGTRIFIFREGDQQLYKTIFIKNNNRLKVIDLENDELLMNEQIN